jgi:hypothetical protein
MSLWLERLKMQIMDPTRLTTPELQTWARGWTAEQFAEAIAEGLWDVPAIESRDEFKASLLMWVRPLFELVQRHDSAGT